MRRARTQSLALHTGDSANTSLKWLLGDHLGSTSVTADYAGTLISRTLYKSWGEIRYQSGTLPTQYTYTGQYSHTSDFGLMYSVARWYDPVLGRFAQADSLVPGAGNPMAWDRYAYALNAPVGHVDPSGHRTCTAQQAATGDETCDQNIYNPIELQIKTICKQMDCYGDNVTWIDVDFSIVADLLGYNPGVVSVPVHTDVNYSVYNQETGKWERNVSQHYLDNPNLLFPWEGPALVLYSEHRQFHPDGTNVVYPDVWIEAAIGILNTMWVRMTNDEKWSWPDYQTLNQSAFSSYAFPQIPESRYGGIYEPRFNEFLAVTLSWYFLNLKIADHWSYDFFNHRRDGATCFGPTAGAKEVCVP